MAAALDHVNVVVAEIERSVAFYSRLLGLAVIMDRVLDGPWFEALAGIPGARARCVILDAPGGGCRVELLRFEAADGTPLPANSLPATIGLRHFALRVDDLDTALAVLAAEFGQEAAPVEVPHHIVRGGKRMAYVRDPDGAVVELAQYGAARPEFL